MKKRKEKMNNKCVKIFQIMNNNNFIFKKISYEKCFEKYLFAFINNRQLNDKINHRLPKESFIILI